MGSTVGRKTFVGSLGALALAAASAYAAAAPEAEGARGRRHGRHEWGMAAHMARALDLTEEQRASFKQVLQETAKAQEPLRQQERELRQQIRQQLEGGSPDATAIGQLTIQAHGLAKQRRESWKGVTERLEGLLTPEQKTKLEEMKSRREERGRRTGPQREKRAPGAEL
jgi:Spy/CpxP family protein refolding chaperone